MPDDAPEGVAEHSSKLLPSSNLHAPATAALVPMSIYVYIYPEEMNLRVPKPCPVD